MPITNPNGTELQLPGARQLRRNLINSEEPFRGPRISTEGFSVNARVVARPLGFGNVQSLAPDSRFEQALIAAGYRPDYKVSLGLAEGVDYTGYEGAKTAKLRLDVRADELMVALKIENGVPQYYVANDVGSRNTANNALFTAQNRTVEFDIPLAPQSWSGKPASQFMGLGIGQAIVHFFVIKIIREIYQEVTTWLLEEVEEHILQNREGFQWMRPGFGFLDQNDLPLPQGEYALFIHGIFSSIPGAFSPLLQTDVLTKLRAKYGSDNVIGYNHFYLSKEPRQNAEDLLAQLPDNSTFDIVCHSRGGAVARFLTEDEDLVATANRQNIKFNKVLYVAGCLHGTQLAVYGNWKTLLNVYTAIANLLGPLGVHLNGIIGFLTVLAHGVTSLASIDALALGNPLYKQLDSLPGAPAGREFIMANFYDPLLFGVPALQQSLSLLFQGAKNDVVVPFNEAGWIKSGTPTFKVEFAPGTGAAQKQVWHIHYFEQAAVQDEIKKYLG